MPGVPRRFPSHTIVCVATGPSLHRSDVEAVRGRYPVIAVNDAYRLAPWADALYACDPKWWRHHPEALAVIGDKYGLRPRDRRAEQHHAGVTALQDTGPHGLELNPTGLRHGHNSGYQALGLAVHFGASRIVLLGYDMGFRDDQSRHFFGEHDASELRQHSPYSLFISAFQTLVDPLAQLGISVLNCSRQTALDCFPRVALEAVLSSGAAA